MKALLEIANAIDGTPRRIHDHDGDDWTYQLVATDLLDKLRVILNGCPHCGHKRSDNYCGCVPR